MSPLDERMAGLRLRFLVRAAAEREALAAAFARGDLVEVGRIAHGLAGAGGTFGFPALSDAAAGLEEALLEGAAPEALGPLVGGLLGRLDQLRANP
jgi:HPt (histidine-containing phosphotransfer) domain-containing protein